MKSRVEFKIKIYIFKNGEETPESKPIGDEYKVAGIMTCANERRLDAFAL